MAGQLFSSLSATVGRLSLLDSLHFFWADERCVPAEDRESNYRVAQEFLLQPLGIEPSRIHRIRGEMTPEWAASEAEAELCRIAPLDERGRAVLDLVLLGMGEDGHVASLFPDAPLSLRETTRSYVPVVAPRAPTRRVTLSFQTLAAAKEVWVIVSGEGKTAALEASLSPEGTTPLALLLRSRRETTLFTDCGH